MNGTTEGSGIARKYGLSWAPKEPEGSGRGRMWPGVTDEQWAELYGVAVALPVTERDTLCKAYFLAFQTLARKAGNGAPPATRARVAEPGQGAGQPAKASRASGTRRSRTDVIEGLEDDVAGLEEALKRARKKLTQLESMTDEEFGDLQDLIL